MVSSHVLETNFDGNIYLIKKNGEENERKSKKNENGICIIGYGNYGRALALRFKSVGINFVVGSRSSTSTSEGNFLSYEEAISLSSIVFLCIPTHSFESLIPELSQDLQKKIVVDVSNLDHCNDESNAIKLQKLLPSSYVVKALNTVSAYSLENDSYGASRDTYVCCNSEPAKMKVIPILRQMGLNPVDKGLLDSAASVEKLPFKFFPHWGTAITITICTLIPLLFYTYLRFFWFSSEQVAKEKHDLPLYISNRLIAWLMFWLLALTYFPGVIAGFIQIIRRTKYSRFPWWLDDWMKCRKQLGLISLLLAGVHGCMSCLLMGAGEIKYMMEKIPVQGVNQTVTLYQYLGWTQQTSLLFATLSMALMGILGVTSLPSVNARMSWREWDFIQSGLGFTSLVFGFAHVMFYVYKLWDPNYEFGLKYYKNHPKGSFPPGAFIMPMLPLLVIVLKLVLMLPGVSCYLSDIRRGKTGYRQIYRYSKAEEV